MRDVLRKEAAAKPAPNIAAAADKMTPMQKLRATQLANELRGEAAEVLAAWSRSGLWSLWKRVESPLPGGVARIAIHAP
ncbi:hypothetical protein [Luteimonas sp. MC1828]|uniref:hypothetical protein n=1 Tax=Luteimonas sp. MC1828 TaxID=2799787 RepID=UPI0018F2615B|nr:hypothetical protein [Luteimonas sp. MC1828]MBJ7575671.1 hypothetical protein [Luteimonas sp. MC1828]